MTYLLDTHTFLWLLREPETLPDQVQRIARNRSETLALSLVTPWEMAIKVGLGKLDAAEILDNFERLTTLSGYSVLETTVRQVIHSGRLPLHHKDPFDRLLIAQALDLRIPLLSADTDFDLYGVKRVWD
jgi:PIN domain nuclease of toxin-antitoxin system